MYHNIPSTTSQRQVSDVTSTSVVSEALPLRTMTSAVGSLQAYTPSNDVTAVPGKQGSSVGASTFDAASKMLQTYSQGYDVNAAAATKMGTSTFATYPMSYQYPEYAQYAAAAACQPRTHVPDLTSQMALIDNYGLASQLSHHHHHQANSAYPLGGVAPVLTSQCQQTWPPALVTSMTPMYPWMTIVGK